MELKKKTFDPRTTPLTHQNDTFKKGYKNGYEDGVNDGAVYATTRPRYDMWVAIDKKNKQVVATNKNFTTLYKEYSHGYSYAKI